MEKYTELDTQILLLSSTSDRVDTTESGYLD